MIEVNQEVMETVEELLVVVEDPPQMMMPMVFNQIKAFLGTHDSSISDEEAYKKYAKCKLEFNLCCSRHF